MSHSPLPLRKWAFAIYLCVTSLKGVSSMKLHRDLKVSQKTAWFLAHRIREAMTGRHGKTYRSCRDRRNLRPAARLETCTRTSASRSSRDAGP